MSLQIQNILIFAVPILIGAIFGGIYYYDKKRSETIKNFARKRGLNFIKGPNDINSECKILKKGHTQKSKNILSGRINGQDLEIYDYNTTSGYGKNRSTQIYLVCVVKMKKSLPLFEIKRKPLFGNFFAKNWIEFQNQKEFSKKYGVYGNIDIKTLFSPQILQYFKNLKKTYYLESGGNDLVIYRKGKINPKNLDLEMRIFSDIVNLFR